MGRIIGVRSLTERINQMAPLLAHAHHTSITQVPAVIQCDGMWVRLQIPTGTGKPDRRRRRRQHHKGTRMVRLVALGRWADSSGRRDSLAWERAEGDTQSDWQRVLDRLWDRVVRPEAGLQAVRRDGKGAGEAAVAQVSGTRVIEPRGVFHTRRNVADTACEDASGEVHREERGRGWFCKTRAIRASALLITTFFGASFVSITAYPFTVLLLIKLRILLFRSLASNCFLRLAGGSPLNSYENYGIVDGIKIAEIGTYIKVIKEHTESGAFAGSAVAHHLM